MFELSGCNSGNVHSKFVDLELLSDVDTGSVAHGYSQRT